LDAVEDLPEAFALLENTDEIRDFLRDLLTPNEIEALAVRWRVMCLLAKGSRPGEVHEITGVSRTTIGRANRVVRHGTGIIKKLVNRSSGLC
jgi:TrpR-related protein YerC/YecD